VASRRACLGLLLSGSAAVLSACAGYGSPDAIGDPTPAPTAPPQPAAALGSGQVRIGLILPLSAAGNAALAAQTLRNAADMALAEFKAANIQLLVKDDGGSVQGAQQGVQRALDEGAQVILGPLFAQSVAAVAPLARARNVSVIAFSTDSTVAGRGVYLLSFLPQSDVARIIDYAAGAGRRSIVAMIPENAYGSVAETAFRQAAARGGVRIVTLERYTSDRARLQDAARAVAQAAAGADAIFIPDGADGVSAVVPALAGAGVDTRRVQLLGTGLWDEARIFADPALQGALYAAPDTGGFRSFALRYRGKFGQDPARTATLAYDAAALVAALVKTQGPQALTDQGLTNPSGFAGVDGVFRFRPDGTNERGLAVLRVTQAGGQVVVAAPRVLPPAA
jgi:ABC-type branched-subunit amino acid transport system substrate-binding protein